MIKSNNKEILDKQTKGLASRGQCGFEEGNNKILDGGWPDNDDGKLESEFIVPNSLHWSKWNLESHYEQIEKIVKTTDIGLFLKLIKLYRQ